MKIEITKQEAEDFKKFREHQEIIERILSSGIKELKNGKITIHKDNNGKIRKIEINRVCFKS